ncbi:MAG: hypothetical protein QXF79_01825 [Ignisphaera sp.]
MVLTCLLNRERGIARSRPRPEHKGNYITITKGSTVYALVYGETPSSYIKHKPYAHPYTKAYGYIDNPPPTPPLKPVGPAPTLEAPTPSGTVFTPITESPPPGITITKPPVTVPGDAYAITPSTTPTRIYPGSLVVKRLTLLASMKNIGNIWVKPRPDVAPGSGFPLAPGAARDFDNVDIGWYYVIAENTTDIVYAIWEV